MSCSCPYELKAMPIKNFANCDGSPWSNDFLKRRLKDAVKEENYEFAQECKDELERRLKAKN